MLLNTTDRARAAIETDRPPSADAGSRRQPSSTPAQASSIALIDVVKDALIRHFGSLKAAGIALQYDLGQLSRDLQSGDFKFRRLEGHADSDAIKRLITQGMLLNHGPDDPKTRRRRVIRDLRARIDELAEIEGAA